MFATNFPQADGLTDGVNTDHFMESNADTSVEQPTSTPTHPCSTKHDPCHNPKPICNDDYRYWNLSPLHEVIRNADVYFVITVTKCYGATTEQVQAHPKNFMY